MERDGLRVTVGEEPAAVDVLQILLQPTQRPGTVFAEAEDLTADRGGLLADAVRLGKEVGVDEAKEVREAVFVSMVGRGREQDHVVSDSGEALGKLVAAHLGLCVRRALVRLVDDDEVPALLPDAFAHIILLGIVEGRDHLVRALPGINELLLVHGGEDDVERLPEPAQQFVLPLDGQRCGTEDQDALDRLPQLELLDQEASHNGLPGAGVVRQE
jgi:hypothetical protein